MKIILKNTIAELIGYIKDVLNVELSITQLPDAKLKTLPFILANEYVFGETKLFNRNIILMFIDPYETSVDKIRKHLDIVINSFNAMVVVIVGNVEAYTRKRLIEKKVPFIIAGKQMYLPDLLIDLKEYAPVQREQPELMLPSAQCLLLYHLQVEPLEKINLKTIADKLHYMPMSVTRAAYYLHNTGLCVLEGTKDKYLKFEKSNRDLWDKALPLLISPIKKTNYFSGQILRENLRRTNINALAKYSDINDEPVEYYALRIGQIMHYTGVNLFKTGKIGSNICIEEWKYDPAILTDNEFVDPLSLYLCMRDNKDERIEMALEQLIKNVPW